MNKFEEDYKEALKAMEAGNIVYCSRCDSALSSDKEAFVKHMKKHRKELN